MLRRGGHGSGVEELRQQQTAYSLRSSQIKQSTADDKAGMQTVQQPDVQKHI